MSLVLGLAGGRAILSEETATGKALKVAELHLYTNNLSPTPNNVEADFTEPTGAWYVPPATVTWGTPFNGPSGEPMVTAHVEIPAAAVVSAETINGYYMVLPAVVGPPAIARRLLCAEKFSDPIVIARDGDSVVFDVNFGLSGAGNAETPA